MRATGDVQWCAKLDDAVRSATAAWVVTMADCRRFVGGALSPDASDLHDVGARRGVEAERFLLRRLALRGLVACWCGVPVARVGIGYGSDGRPAVRAPCDGPHCSVTARGEIAGFALSDHPVGIDLEPDMPGEVPWAVLSPDETRDLAALPDAERHAAFLELWTVKEAYLKALGSGLLRDPASITVARRGGVVQDGGHRLQLAATAIRRARIGAQTIVASCIGLAGR